MYGKLSEQYWGQAKFRARGPQFLVFRRTAWFKIALMGH